MTLLVTKSTVAGDLGQARGAFLKSPKNFSGPKTFRGSVRVPKSAAQSARKHPVFSRILRVVFSALY